MRDAIVFPLFSVFVWTGENDSNRLRVDAYFFENGGKNLRYVWTGTKSYSKLSRANCVTIKLTVRAWARLHKTPVTTTGIRTCTRNLSELH